MATEARVLADSVNEQGNRISSLEVTYPRFVLPELISHRVLSRSSASSRAIPVTKLITRVLDDPVIPENFGANQSGMVAEHDLSAEDQGLARDIWLMQRDLAVLGAVSMLGGSNTLKDPGLKSRISVLAERYDYQAISPQEGVHKEIVNRLLENWMWATTIVTATDFGNFMALRTDRNAQPQIQQAALRMQEALEDSTPAFVDQGGWHMPLVRPEDMQAVTTHELVTSGRLSSLDMLKQLAVGRCARVSYLTHDGRRDPAADIALHDRLLLSGHMSPFEHVATPMSPDAFANNPWAANFRGWEQYRRSIPGEHNFAIMQEMAAAAVSQTTGEFHAV